MCTCMCNWVTMLYSRKKQKLYWGNNNKNFKKKVSTQQTAQQDGHCYPHFRDDKTQKNEVICPRSQLRKGGMFGVPLYFGGLRIQHCHCYSSGCRCGMGSIPDPGISTRPGHSQKKKKGQNVNLGDLTPAPWAASSLSSWFPILSHL